MATDEERCAEAQKFERIDEAFHKGDLDTLRVAVDDPAAVPNGRVSDAIGSCLVYAIYHSPLAFIRTLLDVIEFLDVARALAIDPARMINELERR